MMKLGVIGGSGLYQLPGAEVLAVHELDGPYGRPSSPITHCRLGELEFYFLARHGKGHHIAPHELPSKANIWALRTLGAEGIVSISAVGSMKEEHAPGRVVVVDQYIDWTKQRPSTFFEKGLVAHVSMAEPTCPILSRAVYEAVLKHQPDAQWGGTYLCMEGPQFSSRVESDLYRSWGVDVIGMTAMPEAKLAREASLPYCTLALCTDYDCWRREDEPVSVEEVIAVLKQNSELAGRALTSLASVPLDLQASPARSALDHAVITAANSQNREAAEALAWLLSPKNH